MIISKEKVTLVGEQATLLIPLHSKASESRRPSAIFADEKAQEILARVDYDFSRLQVPRKTAIALCLRASKLDAYARQFLARHPWGVIVHLGCGLDSRCLRVPHPGAEWYDLDLPDVIELRRKFYQETAHYHMLASSVTDLTWTGAVAANNRPVLAIAEGLLMYLREAEVQALFLKLQQVFPGCELACDVYSRLTARRAGAIRSLKETGATIRWGIDDALEIERWAPGICLQEEWYFTRSPEIERLGPGYRLAYRMAGLFPAANRAHRLLYLCL